MYTKEQAISIVTKCAEKYKNNFVDKVLLFICMNRKTKRTSYVELTFDTNNYLHLTGLKLKRNKNIFNSKDFYNKCLNNKLSINDFDFAEDGTTPLKLDVLPRVIGSKYLAANLIGDYNMTTIKLYTDKLVGNINACVGFVIDEKTQKYVPNTLLKFDIRDNTINQLQVIAVFRKNKKDNTYSNSEIIYTAKIDFSTITFPKEYEYLLQSILSE